VTSYGCCRGESRTTLTQSPEPSTFFVRTGIQPSPGTYALLLSSATDSSIRVGRLGDLRLRPRYYVYVGSALGPGGVRGCSGIAGSRVWGLGATRRSEPSIRNRAVYIAGAILSCFITQPCPRTPPPLGKTSARAERFRYPLPPP